uniref:Uncharacterized protein n=1 Tax=viral metagenome TaxID=1070528 RepID=A0A6C0EK75_9ZZZZ
MKNIVKSLITFNKIKFDKKSQLNIKITSKEEVVISSYNYNNCELISSKGGIKIFIDSLRKFNKNCTVIVLCSIKNKSIMLENYLKENNSNILYYNFIEIHHDDRFFIIQKFLKKNVFSRILIADMNDIIFQSNPFEIISNNKLYCSLENNILSDPGGGSCNLRWLIRLEYILEHKSFLSKKTVTKNLYKKYKDKNVICCGTIISEYNTIMEYLNYYMSINKKGNLHRIPRVVGQGIYIDYCYKNTDKCIIKNQEFGKILTLDNVNFNKISRDNNGYLINSNSEKYCIIHQIDRCGQKNLEYLKNIIL